MPLIPVSYPTVNGYRYSWASIVATIASGTVTQQLVGLKAISYSNSVARSEVRGEGRQRLGFTAGNVGSDCSFTILKEEWFNFIFALDQLGPYLDQPFDLAVSYSEGAIVKTDTIVGCKIKKDAHDHSQGTDGLEVKVDLDITYILLDGITTPFTGFRT
jgi:hypothetical protein